jgi:hypothetical protein
VGWNVGENNVWIAAARLLYCFDFEQDEVSRSIHAIAEQSKRGVLTFCLQNNPIDTMRIPQLTKNKAPFPVKIQVRSQAHADLIERDCAEAVSVIY